MRTRVGWKTACVAGLVAAAGAMPWPMSVRAQVGDRAAVDTAPPPAHWEIPDAPVRTPDESMRMMDLPPGFRIELVAAEPFVMDPIAFAFDAHGRLWVLEWPSYNWPLRDVLPGLAPQPAPPGRLAVLDDTDGDGRMDRRTLFAELPFPRGFQLVEGGVLAYALPEVVMLRDTDGDDRADVREVLADGLPVPVNPHLAPSSPSWTLDNWTYALQVGERLKLARGARDAAPAGRMAGQWGMSHDDVGRLFFSYNQDHLRGSLVPVTYASRNPNYDASAGVDVRIGMDNEVWPHAITPGVNRRAQLHDDGRLRVFTANAAPLVYRGDQFPAEYRGNVFVGESAGRLIRRTILSEGDDGVITGRNAYEQREFLFSHDERVRPVYSATGPDGALYVADMYRGVIEGHIFLTTFLRHQILARSLHQPFHGMGRIYRIVHSDGPDRRVARPPTPTTPDGWVERLAHQNGHWRDLAQQALVNAADPSTAPALQALVARHGDARTRLQALWTLEGMQAMDGDTLQAALRDASPYVRVAALRIAEPLVEAEARVRQAVLALGDDESPMVRRQVMFTLGASRHPDVLEAMWLLLQRDHDVPFVVDAFVSGVGGRELEHLQRLFTSDGWATDQPGVRMLATALATAVANEGDPDRVDEVVRLAAGDGAQPAWRRLALLEGLAATRRETFDVLPASLARLSAVTEPSLAATAQAVVDRFRRAGDQAAAATTMSAAEAGRIEAGASAYALCAACHQQDGRGLPALAPALAGAATVTGPAAPLIDIVLHGRDADPAYPNMPPLASLSDDQLASILTYVRQAWGNGAGAVSADDVRARRDAGSTTRPQAMQAPVPAADVTPPAGFTALFNGRDLTGWRGRPGRGGVFSPYVEAAFSAEERAARQAEWDADRDAHWFVDADTGDLVTDGKGVHLATIRDYADFELLVDWKLTEPGGITGIYLRSYPQVQLWDPASPEAHKTGGYRGSGALWNNNDDNPGKWPLVKADRPIGAWNQLRVRMIGTRVWVWLNDQLTVDGQVLDNYFDRSRPVRPAGAIELQSHGTEVRFRNVFIRELTAKP